MRVVLDPNVLVAALLSPAGTPAQLVSRWLGGEFELVISEALLAELGRALSYPKLRARVQADAAAELVALLAGSATVVPDVAAPPARSEDSNDDYLIALAETQHAVLVSGDSHVLLLSDRYPIQTARAFLDKLEGGASGP